MARKSLIARNQKRIKLAERYAKNGQNLKKKVIGKGCKNYRKIHPPCVFATAVLSPEEQTDIFAHSAYHASVFVSRCRKDIYQD